MKKPMIVTQWVLGIIASLSLIFGIAYKIVYMITGNLMAYTSPMGFLWLTMACASLSIALSLIKIGKIMDENKK